MKYLSAFSVSMLLSVVSLTPGVAKSTYRSQHSASLVPVSMNLLDQNSSGSYGLVGKDLNGNGFQELVSFAYSGTGAGSTEGEVILYRYTGEIQGKMTWKKSLIAKKKHVVHGSFVDVNRNSKDDLIFMSDFEVPRGDPGKEGLIWWAEQPDDLDKEWPTHLIGKVPGAHRIVTGDFNGDGQKQVLVVPLFGEGNPIDAPANLVLFDLPHAGNSNKWVRWDFKNHRFRAMHEAVLLPGDKDKILMASREGIIELNFSRGENRIWNLTPVTLAAPPSEKKGDLHRDLGFRSLGKNLRSGWANMSGVTSVSSVYRSSKGRIIAAIDYTSDSSFLNDQPWHGDTVSLYYKPDGLSEWKRQVIEKRTAGGHAIQIIEKEDKDCPDVLAGFREYPTSLVLYHCKKIDENGIEFEKQIISERSANAIVKGNWRGRYKAEIVTAGFGARGDSYLTHWGIN